MLWSDNRDPVEDSKLPAARLAAIGTARVFTCLTAVTTANAGFFHDRATAFLAGRSQTLGYRIIVPFLTAFSAIGPLSLCTGLSNDSGSELLAAVVGGTWWQ